MFGLGLLKSMFGGILPFSKLRVVLIIPARPEAPSRCPMFVLTEPTYKGEFRFGAKTEPMARDSAANVSYVDAGSKYGIQTHPEGHQPI